MTVVEWNPIFGVSFVPIAVAQYAAKMLAFQHPRSVGKCHSNIGGALTRDNIPGGIP